MSDLKTRFNRLVERCLARSLLPFVGAGFSYGALHDPSGWVSGPDRMMELLRAHLDDALSDCSREAPYNCSDGQLARDKQPGFGIAARTLRELFCSDTGSLARWAELAGLIGGPRAVCEVLQMDQYEELRPLPSHRYLAYLAREGLIREVITTNYDSCIEKAFEESKGFDSTDSVVAIRCLEEYRRLAGKHARAGNLLIYKINGCAAEYADAKRDALAHPGPMSEERWDAVAKRIILTERQLQNFRREHWARDLFRDRARSRSLLFSGFGSEEPQIRHTALTLMEEFADQYADGNGLKEWEIIRLPNIPFIQVHGTELSFYQLQILVAFWDAHARPHLTKEHPERRVEPMLATVFSGGDACELDSCEERAPRLSASLFFRAIFERAFCRRVGEEICEGGRLSDWLRWHSIRYREWLGHLRRSLGFDANEQESEQPAFLARLLAPACTGAPFPLMLWRLLWAMKHPGQGLPTDWYYPLREDPLFVLVALLLISFRTDTDSANGPEWETQVGERTPHGFPVAVREEPLSQDDMPPPIRIHLLHEHALDRAKERGAEQPDDRLLRVIAVPSRYGSPPDSRWSAIVDGGNRGRHRLLVTGRHVVIPAGEVIREAGTPGNFAKALFRCFADSRTEPAARLRRIHSSTEGFP